MHFICVKNKQLATFPPRSLIIAHPFHFPFSGNIVLSAMASFMPTMGAKESTETSKVQYPLRLMLPRLNSAIQGFKVDLKRLQQHKANIGKVNIRTAKL